MTTPSKPFKIDKRRGVRGVSAGAVQWWSRWRRWNDT